MQIVKMTSQKNQAGNIFAAFIKYDRFFNIILHCGIIYLCGSSSKAKASRRDGGTLSRKRLSHHLVQGVESERKSLANFTKNDEKKTKVFLGLCEPPPSMAAHMRR